MDMKSIRDEIDAEIHRLQQAKALLGGTRTVTKGRGRSKKAATAIATGPTATRARRALSPAARKKIGDAQRKRWAKVKAAAKKENRIAGKN